VLSGGQAGSHKIQGIGAGFVPTALNTAVYDEVVAVADTDAFATAREVARTESLLVGISAGAALWAASRIAARPEFAGKTVVALVPDSGERYMSMGLFEA
jgi:cysteine synthase A